MLKNLIFKKAREKFTKNIQSGFCESPFADRRDDKLIIDALFRQIYIYIYHSLVCVPVSSLSYFSVYMTNKKESVYCEHIQVKKKQKNKRKIAGGQVRPYLRARRIDAKNTKKHKKECVGSRDMPSKK